MHMTLTVHIFRHDVLILSNYKHDVYASHIGLVITNYIQEFCYNFD